MGASEIKKLKSLNKKTLTLSSAEKTKKRPAENMKNAIKIEKARFIGNYVIQIQSIL